MSESDKREQARREAYAAYNRLLWQLAKLATGDPERARVLAKLADAERTRRRLLGVPDTGSPE